MDDTKQREDPGKTKGSLLRISGACAVLFVKATASDPWGGLSGAQILINSPD